MLYKKVLVLVLLFFSSIFMFLARYGHLKFENKLQHYGLWAAIIFSWLIALLEFLFLIPANKIGFDENGGPFNIFQLQILQQAFSLISFVVLAWLLFREETLRWNHAIALVFIILAVYFVFKK